MPTYQYACTECSHAFEQVQSFSDDALTECPQCQGRLRKLFNAVGVVFKGSGFYRTDSRASSEQSGKSEKSEKSGASSEGSGSGEKKKDAGSSGSSESSSGSSGSSTKSDSTKASASTKS